MGLPPRCWPLTFGLTVPIIKAWFGEADPWLLAGLLYLGSGVGLAIWSVIRGGAWSVPRLDLPWLVGAVLAGGIVAPVLLLWPSRRARQHGSAVADLRRTVHESSGLGRISRALRSSYRGRVPGDCHGGRHSRDGPRGCPPAALVPTLLVLAACLAWGIDNNLTRVIALADPIQVAATKGLIAGLTNTILALSMGARMPPLTDVVRVGGVGFMGYGLSLVLFVYALRELGTSRTAAYFSFAPFGARWLRSSRSVSRLT